MAERTERAVILLVGTKLGELHAYATALETAGFIVLQVETAERALRAARTIAVDGVVVDRPPSDALPLMAELSRRGVLAPVVLLEDWLRRDRRVYGDAMLGRVLGPGRLVSELRARIGR